MKNIEKEPCLKCGEKAIIDIGENHTFVCDDCFWLWVKYFNSHPIDPERKKLEVWKKERDGKFSSFLKDNKISCLS